ncbi:LemA family protein [Planctomycetes bacterium CA13]|uniref:LemA family protein n=1 Tax=Novipirellula herctigrandis TaxID=2527986 RepID=A0A5C5Z1A8_9BACT|nr:LemA family protein [Planctomycetes bacterium CA13]
MAVLIGFVLFFGGIVLFLLLYGVQIFNRLVTLRNRIDNAFSQIEVQLKRRHDLIPNLVETVKGYMAHERETLEAVINARNQAVGGLSKAAADPSDPEALAMLAGAEKGLSGALGRLFALAEAYPDLKANQNMAQLTEEITTTENKISFSRQAYNDSVTEYNTYRQTFPPVLFATAFGHTHDRELLKFDDEKLAEAPKVSFS